MTNKEIIKLLYSKHITLTIDWGGVPGMFINSSTMSEEGAVKLLDTITGSMSKKEIENELKNIIDIEHEIEHESTE
jgi:ketol-acid reductoisomerase